MRYNLFGVGQKGKSPSVSAQARLNMYMDLQPQEDKTRYSYHATPGLTLFSDFNSSVPVRGMLAVDTLLYVVHGGTFYEVNSSGTATSRGTLTTTDGRVDMAYNHAGVLMVTDGTNGYYYTIASTTFATITDGQYNDNAATVVSHDGYFIVPKPDTAEFYLSSLDATDVADSWAALDFGTAEKSPDNMVRIFENNTDIMLCGTETIEFWNNTGSGTPPYDRITGGVIELGLAARWSITKFGESEVVLLATNSDQGGVSVVKFNGFQFEDISSTEMGAEINTYSIIADASSLSYYHNGHYFYQINFPTEGKSWLYDGRTNVWSNLEYGSLGARHRAEIGVNYRNKFYVSDYANGKIYQIDGTNYTDDGEPIVKQITSKHIFNEDQAQVSRLWLDIESGTALVTGQGSDPQMMLEVSKDGGHSWGNEHWASMGKQGERNQRVIYRRLGRAFDWVFKFRCSEPIKLVIIGAWIDSAG
jgi:hypothetical protein